MKLFFIRHGETTGDVEDRYGGAYDDELSPTGQQQVSELAKELAHENIEQVFTSPLIRAKQTAQALVTSTHASLVEIEALKERDQYGVLSGLTKQQAQIQYPDLVLQLKDRLNTLPDAESYADASKRNAAGYHQVIEQTRQVSAIVWHSGGMRVLFRDILKLGELNKVGDTGWVEIDYEQDQFKLGRMERIERKG